MAFVGAALPLNREGLTVAAAHVEVDPAALWSVVVVETSGCGFLPDRRPSILFERHIFSTRTGRRFDASHPPRPVDPPGGTVHRGRTNTSGWPRRSPAIGVLRWRAPPGASVKSWGSTAPWPVSATPSIW